jgi:GNAT superfamily N-acetyltransferase
MIEHAGARTGAEWEELRAGEENSFGESTSDIAWRGKDVHTGFRKDGRLIASVGLVAADVHAGDERFEVVGVGGVIVSRDFRRQGYLRPTLDAALERAATLGPERAMLFCSRANAGLYASFGFAEIDAPVVAAQPEGRECVMPPPAMWRPLREGVTWPAGDVRLPGLPF